MTATKLVFTGQIAPDPTAGDNVAAQARSVFSRLTIALSEQGLVPEDLLRLRLFVDDLGELPAIEAAVDSHVGAERPAMSVIELPAAATEPGVALTLDAVAAPESHALRRLRPQSVRFGPWVFLGAVTATDPRALFALMQERLHEQGAELRDIVKVGGWLTFPMRDYGPLGDTRSALVDQTGLLPASAAVQIGRVGRGDQRLAFEAIAFVPEDHGRETSDEDLGKGGAEDRCADAVHPTDEAISRLADFYVDARAAGGHVFTSGEVPDGRGSPAEQAREVYERLRAHLAAHGVTPADVLQQTVFVRAAKDGESDDAVIDSAIVSEAARAFYGANATLPPTTLLPVADFGFRPGCDVEIELVAASDVRHADGR
ncbi:MAG: Rid family hydrolase [Solirubrobacteraceae bacterium]